MLTQNQNFLTLSYDWYVKNVALTLCCTRGHQRNKVSHNYQVKKIARINHVRVYLCLEKSNLCFQHCVDKWTYVFYL